MESFFGNAKPSRPAMVQSVTVKKVVKAVPGQRPQLSSSLSNRNGVPSSSSKSSSLQGKRPKPVSRDSTASKASSRKLSPGRSLGTASPRKRKNSPQRVLPPSDSESDSDDALAPKRRKANGATPSIWEGEGDLDRKVFCPARVDERGEFGRGYAGFVHCEDAVRGVVRGWAGGSVNNAKDPKDKYQAYFPQPGFENADPMPSVELRYPSGATERFILLTPTSVREYNPVSELRNVVRLILKHYIPPSHAHIFGTLDASGEMESAVPSRFHTPTPGALTTPPPDGASPSPAPPHASHETIGDAIRRALAPNRRDGPGLVKAIERMNAALAEIQQDGSMAAWIDSPEYRICRQEWSDLVDICHDQAYSRVIAPFSDQLEHHPRHPDEVAAAISEKEDAYGELRHSFMSKIIEQTNLGPGKTFVDLGSGVGNCVVQAALQAGCASYGFELLPVPARCARLQLHECQRRWAMWCLKGNLQAEVHEGDFRRHPQVARRLAEADVVLVNNEVFPSSLNMDLTHLFLDLKEGAVIVSLKPFVPDGFRMNEGNCDSFAAILSSTPHTYYSGWVSWKADSGKYYVQTVDRAKRIRYEEELSRRRR